MKLAHLIEERKDEKLPLVPLPSEQEIERRKTLASYGREVRNRTKQINTLHAMFVHQGLGKEHDFNLYKRTIGAQVNEGILMYADLGYLGMEGYHANCKIPRKAGKLHPLSGKDKAYNKRLARKRVVVEHINAKIKTFRSMAYPYRNHCTRHLLRMSLICGIINFERQRK
jgi:hypothetical protein